MSGGVGGKNADCSGDELFRLSNALLPRPSAIAGRLVCHFAYLLLTGALLGGSPCPTGTVQQLHAATQALVEAVSSLPRPLAVTRAPKDTETGLLQLYIKGLSSVMDCGQTHHHGVVVFPSPFAIISCQPQRRLSPTYPACCAALVQICAVFPQAGAQCVQRTARALLAATGPHHSISGYPGSALRTGSSAAILVLGQVCRGAPVLSKVLLQTAQAPWRLARHLFHLVSQGDEQVVSDTWYVRLVLRRRKGCPRGLS